MKFGVLFVFLIALSLIFINYRGKTEKKQENHRG